MVSEPGAIAKSIKTEAAAAQRVGLETEVTTTWLWNELRALGYPFICIDARHAKAALCVQINKSDRNDAYGVARIMQAGSYKEVLVKNLPCHEVRALLNSRAQLVKVTRDLEISHHDRQAFSTRHCGPDHIASCTGAGQRLSMRVYDGSAASVFHGSFIQEWQKEVSLS